MEGRWLQLVITTAIASSVEGLSRIWFTNDLLEYVLANNLTSSISPLFLQTDMSHVLLNLAGLRSCFSLIDYHAHRDLQHPL